MSYRRIDRKFRQCFRQARIRVDAVWTCVNILCPDAPVTARRKLAKTILKLSEGLPAEIEKAQRKITPAAMHELFIANTQCIKASEGRCPQLIFTEPFARSINHFFLDED